MMRRKLRVGMVGTYIPDFLGERYNVLENSILKMKELSRRFDFEFEPITRPIRTVEDGETARQELVEKRIDFLLLQTSTFPDGRAALPLLQGPWRLGLWAVPEPAAKGPLPLNSLCGINLLGSIMGEYLYYKNKPWKWFFGNPEDEEFLKRFTVTLRALNTIVNINGAKLALIGGVAPGFYDLICDENEYKKLFGIEVTKHEYDEVVYLAEGFKQDEIEKRVSLIKGSVVHCGIRGDDTLKKAAKVELALKALIEKEGYDAVALSCWPRFIEDYKLAVCSSIGRVTGEGTPISCEGDVEGALSMLILETLSKDTPALMDMVAISKEEDTVLLWHCGACAPSLAGEKGTSLEPIWWPHEKLSPDEELGLIYDTGLKNGPWTIMRPFKKGHHMLISSGENSKKDKGWHGVGLWLENLKMNGEPIGAINFLNTIMVWQFPHHYPIIRGEWTNELIEICAWLGIEPIEAVHYKDFLQMS